MEGAGEVTLYDLEQRRQLAVKRCLDGDPIEIMYHPQSGWFDEGPQRGPATWRKGLKAL